MPTVVCASCQKQKNELRPRKSVILKNTTWLLCRGCFDGQFEPRWAIIAELRSTSLEDVPDIVTKLIREHKYVGEEIKVREALR